MFGPDRKTSNALCRVPKRQARSGGGEFGTGEGAVGPIKGGGLEADKTYGEGRKKCGRRNHTGGKNNIKLPAKKLGRQKRGTEKGKTSPKGVTSEREKKKAGTPFLG